MPCGVTEDLLNPAQCPGPWHREFVLVEVQLGGIVQVNCDLVAEEGPDHRIGGQRLEDFIQRLSATETCPKTPPAKHVGDQGQMISVLSFMAVIVGCCEYESCGVNGPPRTQVFEQVA